MTLTEFLLARIAEDEQAAQTPHALAEARSKREIVEHYQLWEPTLYRDGGPKYDGPQETMYRMAMRWVLERLARPYAMRPEFREEWGDL